MELKSVQVQEYQSVRDSNEFTVGDITCLVGKNEAGKTAILQALYHLNPIVENGSDFRVVHDYPRSDVSSYERDVASKKRDSATIVRAKFELTPEDIAAVENVVGTGVLVDDSLVLIKGYENSLNYDFAVNTRRAITNAMDGASLLPELRAQLEGSTRIADAKTLLDQAEQTEAVVSVKAKIDAFAAAGDVRGFVFNKVLRERIPEFLYFDEYYQMKGRANIEALQQRIINGQTEPSDHPLLGLIHLAGLEIGDLLGTQETRELKNRLEGAGNSLTKNVVKYWSQNRHLGLKFDVRPAAPKDPEGMRSGTNIWAEVYDSRHQVTTELGTRSRGFVWFFSFLAWYSDIQRNGEPVILLLDEPGLSLHARAQEDLLRYFDAEIAGHHQLVYSTHSPFMVDPSRFDRVRIVQDLGIDSDDPLPIEKDGTKVLTDVLAATSDSLFPLQGALGYEIYQTLFVGPNCLVVEGVSDMLYLQGMNAVLQSAGRVSLSEAWTLTPVGGAGKVPTFVALVGAQKGVKVAVLIDYQRRDKQHIDDLFKRRLLQKKNVMTFAEFTGTSEADIEDMFDPEFYLRLVNGEYAKVLKPPLKVAKLDNHLPRMIQKVEKYFLENAPGGVSEFSHYRPARYFSEQLGRIQPEISVETLDRFEAAAKQLNALLRAK